MISTARTPPSQPTFRSGAVARKAGMPVSTLRIWEQRYQAVGPTTAPSGHRLYCAADVERVVLLRHLTQHGHAIGSLATLTLQQLQELASAPASTPSAQDVVQQSSRASLRIVVIGLAMAQRLRRSSVVYQWAKPPHLVGAFDSLQQAVAHAATSGDHAPVDLLLWHAPSLQDDAVADMQAARDAWNARDVAVAYRFAGSKARDALVSAGATVAREPADDGALVAWLSSFQLPAVPMGTANGTATPVNPANHQWFDALVPGAGARPLPQRRFDDTTLTEFAGLSSAVACECPGHLAELLMQIASFESYSAHCASRNAADVALHHYLQRVAGTARVLFEAALERVAESEGLALNSPVVG